MGIHKIFCRCAIASLCAFLPISNSVAGPSETERQAIWATAPEPELVERTIAFYELLTQADEVAVIAYINEHFHPSFFEEYGAEDIAGAVSDAIEFFADVEPLEAKAYPEAMASIIVRKPSNMQWYGLVLNFASMDDDRPTDFDMTRTRPTQTALNLPVQERDIPAELNSLLQRLADADDFSGVAVVSKNGSPLYQYVTGEASKRFGVANTMDTRFCLGSMTKMFTAVAICKLIESGKLSLDDSIVAHLDESWIDPEVGSGVTVVNLLTHSAGVGEFFRHPEYMSTPRSHFRDVNDYAKFVKPMELEFEPGSQWQYSNSGFVMLGAIIESVIGQDYFAYMRENVYGPLGLEESGCIDQDDMTPNVAGGYFHAPGRSGWVSNIYTQRARGCPAGSSYSTAADLLRFASAFRANSVLGSQMSEAMSTPKPDVQAVNYGYGMSLRPNRGGATRWGHAGGGPGVLAHLYMYENGYDITILCNAGRGGQMAVDYFDELMQRLENSGE